MPNFDNDEKYEVTISSEIAADADAPEFFCSTSG